MGGEKGGEARAAIEARAAWTLQPAGWAAERLAQDRARPCASRSEIISREFVARFFSSRSFVFRPRCPPPSRSLFVPSPSRHLSRCLFCDSSPPPTLFRSRVFSPSRPASSPAAVPFARAAELRPHFVLPAPPKSALQSYPRLVSANPLFATSPAPRLLATSPLHDACVSGQHQSDDIARAAARTRTQGRVRARLFRVQAPHPPRVVGPRPRPKAHGSLPHVSPVAARERPCRAAAPRTEPRAPTAVRTFSRASPPRSIATAVRRSASS